MDSLYGTIVDLIAEGRSVPADKARKWLDDGPYQANAAKEAGLIDAIEHRQEFDAMLKKKFGEDLIYERRYGQDKRTQLDFSSPLAMFKIWGELLGGGHEQPSTRPAVGIVYVDGMIVPGKSEFSFFGSGFATSSDIRKALDEAARDEQIKAVVLRVDSPGGSAVASEIILDATRRVKEKKPLIVSMGNVAGSGGYYVSCAADTVFADRSTITASIGCVAGKLVTTDMWKKVGITFTAYDRGKNAGLLSSSTKFSDEERKLIERWMDSVYETFKGHVTSARRDKLKKPLDEIAGGRVYTGTQALELGLVDKVGTLGDAISFAAQAAKLSDYDVRVVPKTKNVLERLMEQAGGSADDKQWIATPSLADAALPYLKGLDPARVSAVRTALQRLQMLGSEAVIMLSPDVYIFE
jgi:protease-4